MAPLIYLSQNYSYYIRGDRSPLSMARYPYLTLKALNFFMKIMETKEVFFNLKSSEMS